MDEMKIPTTGFMDFRIYKHHFSFYTNEQAVQGNSGSDIAAVVTSPSNRTTIWHVQLT